MPGSKLILNGKNRIPTASQQARKSVKMSKFQVTFLAAAAAFLAVGSTAISIEEEAQSVNLRRHLGKQCTGEDKPPACNDEDDVVPCPVDCISGDLMPRFRGVRGEVCLSAFEGLCRHRSSWKFGITGPPRDFDGQIPVPLDPFDKFDPACILIDTNAYLYDGCNPVWEFPLDGASDVCIGVVGPNDFPRGAFAGQAYIVFKDTRRNTNGRIRGDYWSIFDIESTDMPRLKLLPCPKDDENKGVVLKYKRGPDGPNNENTLISWDRLGNVEVNPNGRSFFALNGDRDEIIP